MSGAQVSARDCLRRIARSAVARRRESKGPTSASFPSMVGPCPHTTVTDSAGDAQWRAAVQDCWLNFVCGTPKGKVDDIDDIPLLSRAVMTTLCSRQTVLPLVEQALMHPSSCSDATTRILESLAPLAELGSPVARMLTQTQLAEGGHFYRLYELGEGEEATAANASSTAEAATRTVQWQETTDDAMYSALSKVVFRYGFNEILLPQDLSRESQLTVSPLVGVALVGAASQGAGLANASELYSVRVLPLVLESMLAKGGKQKVRQSQGPAQL